MKLLYQQFGAKPQPNAQTVPGTTAVPGETNAEQPPAEATPVPEDITTFYDKIDKEDEDEEDAQLKTVSFEVNQVSYNLITIFTYFLCHFTSLLLFHCRRK